MLKQKLLFLIIILPFVVAIVYSFIQTSGVQKTMEYLLDLYVLATSLVSIASVVCNYTETPKDDELVAKAYKILEQFAFLNNKAKQQQKGVTMAVQESVKETVDIVAASTGLLSLVAWLPPTASLFTIVWLGIRIFETETIQKIMGRDK